MNLLNLLLSSGLILSICWALWSAWKSAAQLKKNNFIADELDVILRQTLQTIKESKTIHSGLRGGVRKEGDPEASEDLNSPEMLSTILTVIVYKYGTVRLSVDDFKGVSREEYVSVYVDTKTNELILSLNHNLHDGDPMTMAGFGSAEDDTFH